MNKKPTKSGRHSFACGKRGLILLLAEKIGVPMMSIPLYAGISQRAWESVSFAEIHTQSTLNLHLSSCVTRCWKRFLTIVELVSCSISQSQYVTQAGKLPKLGRAPCSLAGRVLSQSWGLPRSRKRRGKTVGAGDRPPRRTHRKLKKLGGEKDRG